MLVPADMRTSTALDAPVHKQGISGVGLELRSALQEAPSSRPSTAPMIPVKYMMYQGQLLFVGDHVAIRGDDSQVYFAIVTDYWLVPTGQKYVRLQWLLPKRAHALQIDGHAECLDPAYFDLGPLHERMEPIECIVDVFFSPQRLKRPLEGPSRVVSSSPSGPEEAERFRDDSLLDAILGTASREDAARTSHSMSPSPSALIRVGAHSDSEMDVRPLGRSLAKPPAQSRYAGNIMDDVEMAHLLCSMH